MNKQDKPFLIAAIVISIGWLALFAFAGSRIFSFFSALSSAFGGSYTVSDPYDYSDYGTNDDYGTYDGYSYDESVQDTTTDTGTGEMDENGVVYPEETLRGTLGETLSLGGIAYTVESADFYDYRDEIGLVLEVRIENTKTSETTYNNGYSTRYWYCEVDGSRYDTDTMVVGDYPGTISSSQYLDAGDITPGGYETGYVGFALPSSGTIEFCIYGNDYDASINDDPAIIFTIPRS